MALTRVACPECAAGLKSPTGFDAGQTVCCPKCETYFVVEEPREENDEVADNKSGRPKATLTKAAAGKKPIKATTTRDDDEDEEDYQPKKKKKKKKQGDDEERSYKNSPMRFAVLGVLILIMLGLGTWLVVKKIKERSADADNKETANSDPTPITPKIQNPAGLPQLQPMIPNGGGAPNPKQGRPPINPGVPPKNPGVPLKNTGGPVGGGGIFDPSPLTPAEKTKLLQQFRSQLIGTWKADLGGGTMAQLVYSADGKVSGTVSGSKGMQSVTGTWATNGEVSRKGLTITFNGTGITTGKDKNIELIFEDDELQHPVFDPIQGQQVIGIFRKV